MKKELNNDLKVFHSTSFDELVLNKKMPYPFDRELINLLKEENRFGQEYYYIESGSDYAFFIVYKNKMNIFTFGKWKCNFNLNVVGFPCSLSNCGYVTNNEKMMLDYIRTIKGAVLVLNVNNPIYTDYMTIGATLPTCIFNNRFETVEEYLGSLRSSYRRRINLARKACEDIEIRDVSDNSADIYQLYLNTYNKSDYKLEKLEKGFFDRVDAHKIAFFKEDVPVGFVLLKQVEDRLIFMLCGMNYDYDTTDLYYYMLFYIVEYAINNKCRVIDFGQTSEATKMKFGAVLEEKYFYARHSNFILNGFVKLCKGLLEYKYSFPKFRVFREDLE